MIRSVYFVVWIGEEMKPVFSSVEDVRDEDKIGRILFGGVDFDTSEFDFMAFNQLRFLMMRVIYFLECR